MRIRFALVDVIAVGEVKALRRRKVATHERAMAFIATGPTTQCSVFSGNHESCLFDPIFRQFRRRNVRTLEHGV